MGDRFKILLTNFGFTNVAFAKEVGVSEGKIRDIIKGRVESIDPKILKYLSNNKINLHWLLTGEGEMILTNRGEASVKDVQIEGTNNQVVIGSNLQVSNAPSESMAHNKKIRKILEAFEKDPSLVDAILPIVKKLSKT